MDSSILPRNLLLYYFLTFHFLHRVLIPICEYHLRIEKFEEEGVLDEEGGVRTRVEEEELVSSSFFFCSSDCRLVAVAAVVPSIVDLGRYWP